jgi:hypothetical protein
MNARVISVGLMVPAFLAIGSTVAAAAPAADVNPDEVRAVYVDAGLAVSSPIFSADRVASFSVDPVSQVGQPALRVFVFLNTESALAEHRLAQAREETRRNQTLAYSDEGGPQLLSGYGLSLWRQNVALVQLAPFDDVGAHAAEIECGDDGTAITPLPRTNVAGGYSAPLEALLGGQALAGR